MKTKQLVFSILLTISLFSVLNANAQVAPEIGNSYYIAAQTWDGTKYVERFLWLNGNYINQTTDITGASVWKAEKPASGSGMSLRCNNKAIMRGGITSGNWGCIIAEPTVTYSNPPSGALTIKSTVTNYAYYVVSPNSGAPFDATNAPYETTCQPVSSAYTPYYKFYPSTINLISVSEILADGTPVSLGASFQFQKNGQIPTEGNVWQLAEGTLSIVPNSFNTLFYSFLGFRVGDDDTLHPTLDLSSYSSSVAAKAVFATNDLEGKAFTFISSYPQWYVNQKCYKAIYLDGADNMLKWKTYDPALSEFYFIAHGNLGNLTLESEKYPGFFIKGATTAAAEQGNRVQFSPLGAGDYNVIANSQNLFAYNYNNGKNSNGTITAAAGVSGSVGAWWVQNVTDKSAEAQRYAAALNMEAEKLLEVQRQTKRSELLAAINSVAVGSGMGMVSQEAKDMAMASYNDDSLTADEYVKAKEILFDSCNLPAVGTIWRINFSTKSAIYATICASNTLKNNAYKSSLYQMWTVAAVNPEQPKQLALRNVGSGTYFYVGTRDYNAPTVTTDKPNYILFNIATPGVFSLEALNGDGDNKYFYARNNGDALILGTMGDWKFIEVPAAEWGALSAEEDQRRSTREELALLISDAVKLSTVNGAIGYFSNLSESILAAQAKYNDETLLFSEYQNAIAALKSALIASSMVAPDADALYIICDHTGRNAMKHVGGAAKYSEYDDTDLDHFWRISKCDADADAITESADGSLSIPWTQRYVLNSVEGENTVLNLTVDLLGNNGYFINIEGDEAWNTEYGLTSMSVHKATIGVDHQYIENGSTYRIRNAATGKLVVRDVEWPARVAMADADETLTDRNQIWKIEKQTGADRYQFHNLESNRHIEEQLTLNKQLVAAFTPGTWHLVPASSDNQYKVLTTMAPDVQLAMGYDEAKAVAKNQADEGTEWIFEKVTPATSVPNQNKLYKILNRYETEKTEGVYDYLYANLSKLSHSYKVPNEYDENCIKWIIEQKDSVDANGAQVLNDNGEPIQLVALRNAYSNQYVYSPNLMSDIPNFFVLVSYSDPNTNVTYSCFKNQAADQYLTPRTNSNELLWYNKITDQYPHWTIIELEETVTDDELYERNDLIFGFDNPCDGAVVKVVSASGTCLDDAYKTGNLVHKANESNKYTQLWRLHQDPVTNLYKFENIYTGNYITNSTVSGRNVTTTADENNAGEFSVARNKYVKAAKFYALLDANIGIGLSNANAIINTATVTNVNKPGKTEWRFILDEEHTEQDYAKMRQNYEENKNMVGNAEKYNNVLKGIFKDNAYTELRDDITQEEIDQAIYELPELLADMVTKFWTNEWPLGAVSGRNWDKTFRIKEYPVTSNCNGMGGVTFVNYAYTQLNEPTGILAHPGDVIAIMVENEPKPGATLKIELVEGLNRAGTQYNLKAGLNLVQASELSNIFVFYMINSVEDKETNYLSYYPDIKVHIEGGEVYGCIDRTRGDASTVEGANKMWKDMQDDGLILNGPMCTLKNEAICFNLNSEKVIQGCPVHIGEVMDIWNKVICDQQWIMGFRDHEGNVIDDYIPHLKERWNNRWLAYERTGGFMNANTAGAQYNTSTIPGIMRFESMIAGEGLWVQAHEHGHDHQRAINTCGMTEMSNNLFSNVCSYEFGATVSRGYSVPDVGRIYINNGAWFDYGIWTLTQMLYKLYLYYHVAGNHPTFWPEVFTRLRQDPLNHSRNVAVPADQDYLKLALVCCEVAGEDLTEMFEAYGMFRPQCPEYSLTGESGFKEVDGHLCRIIDDYGTYYVYTTDEMIAEAKRKMQACGPKNGNILFIDDRVRPEFMTHQWAEPGTVKKERGSAGAYGLFGDVGMYDDFTPEAQKRYAENYTVSQEWTSQGIVLHIGGEGAVGYKFYGPEGELVYFSSFNNITIPAKVLEKYDISDLTLAIAQADGTSVELSSEDNQLFNITTYRGGSKDGITIASRGRLMPELKANDVCVIEPTDRGDINDYEYDEIPNVILKNSDSSYSVSMLKVVDKTDMYLPVDPLAYHVAYQRDNVAGWNSVCLPFPISPEDFGEKAEIYTAKCIADSEGQNVLTLKRIEGAQAGEPCFVLCPDDAQAWNIDKDTDCVVTTSVSHAISDDGQLWINGSFVNEKIGAGKYKLNSSGTSFGATTENGKITAFRSYIETANPEKVASFKLQVVDDDTDGISNVLNEALMQPDVMYDLNGIRISAPQSGRPYILNGQIFVK